MLPIVDDEIQKFTRKHETKLDNSSNPTGIELLDNYKDIGVWKMLLNLSTEINDRSHFIGCASPSKI